MCSLEASSIRTQPPPDWSIDGLINTIGKIDKTLKAYVRTTNFGLRKETKTNPQFVRKEVFFGASHKDIRL
jgi:hypothetical protein